MANLSHVTADTTVKSSRGFVRSVTLTAGTDAATVVVKDGGASGTSKITLKAAAAATVVWSAHDPAGALFGTDIYVDVTGTTPTVITEYD